MIEFENTIIIDRPIGEVFHFVADFENVPKWNYFVQHVETNTDGPVTVGTIYHQMRKTDQQRYVVTVHEPNARVVVETLPGEEPSFTRDVRFERIEQGTHVSDHWTLDLGRIGLLQQLAKRKVRTAVEENLGKLKDLLETGTTRLQDGRMVRIAG